MQKNYTQCDHYLSRSYCKRAKGHQGIHTENAKNAAEWDKKHPPISAENRNLSQAW